MGENSDVTRFEWPCLRRWDGKMGRYKGKERRGEYWRDFASLERDDAASGRRVYVRARMHLRTGLILWWNYSRRKIIQSLRGTSCGTWHPRSCIRVLFAFVDSGMLIEERIDFHFWLLTSIITWKIKSTLCRENLSVVVLSHLSLRACDKLLTWLPLYRFF